MNGCLIPHTPFAVDFWKSRQSDHTRLFFLTHMHADHTSGLSPSWKHPIYCSEITAKLLIHKFDIAPALVHTLEVGESRMLPLDETGQETMTVTVFDANHCPGAVMFLFQGYFGSIFYTGDFRYSPEMFDHEVLANRPSIDVLYLDNTYCSPECKFPSRAQATQMIKDIISRHPEHDIVLGMTMLGKEDMLVELAKTFQTWVVVTPQRLETLKLLELPNVFTTDPEAGRIRVALKYQITRKNMERWNQERPTIAILPSALYTGLDGKPYANQPDVHIVPYSDHSSNGELHDFVSRLKPRSIIPVVKGTSRGVFGTSLQGRADMHCFDNYLNPSAKKTFQIPESVRKFMFHGSHSSIVDVFADTAYERKGKSSRHCVPAAKGRPMGVVFIDSPQSTPEKIKCQQTVGPENERVEVCVETNGKTLKTTSLSSECTKQAERCTKETIPSDDAGSQVKSRKRKLPPSIAIPAQAFAYHTGQKRDCDNGLVGSSPKRIHCQFEKNSDLFFKGKERTLNGSTGLAPLTQQQTEEVPRGQDENSPPVLYVYDFSTDNTLNKSTDPSDKVPSESDNGQALNVFKTLITPPKDMDSSMTSAKASTQSAKKGQLTLDAFFQRRTAESKLIGHSLKDNSPNQMQSEEHDWESKGLLSKKLDSYSNGKEPQVHTCQFNQTYMQEPACSDSRKSAGQSKDNTESHSAALVRNGSSVSNDQDVVCLSDSDSSVQSKIVAPKKERPRQKSQTKSRKSEEFGIDVDVGVGCRRSNKQAMVDEEHTEFVENEIIESLLLGEKADMCSPVQKKGKIVLLKSVVSLKCKQVRKRRSNVHN
ncbi:5' exonuclease Apollo-like [Branchiostoma floridae]|uniref:5' exonuclease Apollo n=2 Tax=Branchiostoma floridae TaxID=7739 RepID=A0A9J7L6E3_BRAFL|nr:5' exonuclease Apollo-like [Branchiostoma floridae]